jgi:hypothetical protein
MSEPRAWISELDEAGKRSLRKLCVGYRAEPLLLPAKYPKKENGFANQFDEAYERQKGRC